MNPLKETMFGRVRRASPSSLDSFDTPPSKIFKDDPLSIYEATLIKLKQGSQRDLSPLPMEAMEMESESETTQSTICSSSGNGCESSINHLVSSSNEEEDMVIDTDTSCSSSILLSSPGVSQSTYEPKQERSKNASVLYLFSKYNSTHHALNLSQGESMRTEASNGSEATSPSSCSCTKQHSEHEFHSSLSG